LAMTESTVRSGTWIESERNAYVIIDYKTLSKAWVRRGAKDGFRAYHQPFASSVATQHP
jgi:hypothetical protein